MKRTEFIEIMNSAIKTSLTVGLYTWQSYTCNMIGHKGCPVRQDYTETFGIYSNDGFSGTFNSMSPEGTTDEEVHAMRPWALLAYKEMMLTFKLYKDL